MKTIKQLENELITARYRVEKAKSAKVAKKLPALRVKFVGTVWQFDNSYGSSKPSWVGYLKITRVDSDGNAYGAILQIDCDGIPSIEIDRYSFKAEDIPKRYTSVPLKVWPRIVTAIQGIVGNLL